MRTLALSMVLTGLTMQVTAQLLLLGEAAPHLTNDDVTQIERIVAEAGARPWLLIARRGNAPFLVSAYLPPDRVTPVLRRGRTVQVSSADFPDWIGAAPQQRPQGRSWTLGHPRAGIAADYAQVAIPGRPFEEIQGDDDPNRPFRVVGTFTDAELVSLGRFIRSGPLGPPGRTGHRAAVEGDRPILDIIMRGEGVVDVRLRHTDLSGQLVTFKASGGAWEVIGVGFWIV